MRLESFQNIALSRFIRRSHRADLRAALLPLSMAAVLGSLSGCVFLPIPVARSSGAITTYRANIDDQAPAAVVQGSTTRRQVLLDLGEPDGRGADDHWFTYQSVSRRGGLHWAYVIGAEGGQGSVGSLDKWDTARRLIIRFDDRGVVASVSFDRSNCTSSFLDSANCPSASGEDLAKADEEQRGERLIASSGEVLGRYGDFVIRRDIGPDCSAGRRALYAKGDQFVVTQHRLLWRNPGQRWDSLAVEDIQDVKMVESHALQPWIPLQTRDGSCLFLQITGVHGMPGSRRSTGDAYSQIAIAVTMTRGH